MWVKKILCVTLTSPRLVITCSATVVSGFLFGSVGVIQRLCEIAPTVVVGRHKVGMGRCVTSVQTRSLSRES